MIDVSFKGIKEVQKMLNGITGEDVEKVKEELKKAVLKVDRMILRDFGDTIDTRTGALKRSFGFEVTGDSYDDLTAGNYSNSPYAPIQEMGGTIDAIDKYMGVPGGPYLNIPTDDNQTPSGVTRFTPKTVFEDMSGYVRRIGSGKYGVFIGTQGPIMKGMGKQQDDLMYTLHESVELEAKLQIRKHQEDVLEETLINISNVIGTS